MGGTRWVPIPGVLQGTRTARGAEEEQRVGWGSRDEKMGQWEAGHSEVSLHSGGRGRFCMSRSNFRLFSPFASLILSSPTPPIFPPGNGLRFWKVLSSLLKPVWEEAET